MYDWEDDVRQANEKIEASITCLETAKASIYLGYEQFGFLDAAIRKLQKAVSLTTRLL